MKRIMADVEVRDKIEVLDPLICPIVCLLRCSINIFILPPIPYRNAFVFFRCTSWCVSCFMMFFLPRIRTAFVSSRNNWCSTMIRSFNASNASRTQSHALLLGLSNYPHWHVVVPSNTYVRQEGHRVVSDVGFNSIGSTMTISKIARLDSSLNIILSFSWSLRIEILFDPAFYFFDFLYIRWILQDCVFEQLRGLWDQYQCSLSKEFANSFQKLFHPFDVSCSVLCPWLAVPLRNLFRGAIYDFIANRLLLLLLHMPLTFQRNFGCWPWCWVFQTILDLLSKKNSENAISWHRIMGDDRKL